MIRSPVGAPYDDGPTTPTATDSPHAREAPTAYLLRHGVHAVVDKLVRDILAEKPSDPGPWMQRWLLEHHRQQCAHRHSMSPLAKLRPDSARDRPPSPTVMTPLNFEDEPTAAP